MWIERQFEGLFFTTNNNSGAAKVAFKSSAKDCGLLMKIMGVVGEATVGGEFASDGELGVSALVVKGVVPFGAFARVGSPLKLADEPRNRQPPMLLERNILRSSVEV